MRNVKTNAILGAALATLTLSAHAGLTTSVSAGPTSAVSGVVTFDFGTSTVDNSGPVASPLSATFGAASYAGGKLFNMDTAGISGVSARPVGSSGNYWSIQGGQVGTVSFSTPLSYYGFLWGSPDVAGWNSVTFYEGSTSLGTFDGTLVAATNAWGNTGYFNVSTTNGSKITSIEFTANANAFETDNHAFITAVPEPETYVLMLAGLGLLGVMARRKKAA
jgi:hypothetical protein